MKATDLKAFLEADLSGSDLKDLIAHEVAQWSTSLRERGRSASITLTGKIASLDVTRDKALRLLDALLTTELPPATFAYVLNALLLSGDVRWSNPTVRDLLVQLVITDTGTIELRDAWKARERLSGPTTA